MAQTKLALMRLKSYRKIIDAIEVWFITEKNINLYFVLGERTASKRLLRSI